MPIGILPLVTNNPPPEKHMSLPPDILNIPQAIRIEKIRSALAFMETVQDGDRIVDSDGIRWTVTPENRMAIAKAVWIKWLRNMLAEEEASK